MEQRKYIVSLDKLELGKHEFEFVLDDAYFCAIDKTELLGGMSEVKAVLDLRENGYELLMVITGNVSVTCDRCLDPMSVAVDINDKVELDDDSREFDLAWLAYELIIVNLPLVHSHQEGGCNPQMAALLQSHLCADVDDEQ